MRSRKHLAYTGGKKVMTTWPSTSPNLGPISYINSGVCVDEKHPGPPYKSGGPLTITKQEHRLAYSQNLQCGSPTIGSEYQGRFWLAPVLINSVPFTPLSDSSLMAWGVKGYNRGLPVHNVVNLGQAFVELKDFPGMLRSTHEFFKNFKGSAFTSKSPKFWAEAWLNNVFGQIPFTNDLISALTYQRQIRNRLEYLRSHNRKVIKRHFDLSHSKTSTRTVSTETYAGLQPVLATGYYDLSGKHNGMIETWKTEETRIWFDGAFTFNIPGLNVPTIDPRLKAKLMGVVPDMNLVYKVTPWTWLIDWFTSVGASVQNASLMQEYGQVAKYAYVMHHRKVTYDTYAYQYVRYGSKTPLSANPLTLVALHATSSYEVKQRGVASPYGFGITWDGLNAFQLSVLASLGITRNHGGR